MLKKRPHEIAVAKAKFMRKSASTGGLRGGGGGGGDGRPSTALSSASRSGTIGGSAEFNALRMQLNATIKRNWKPLRKAFKKADSGSVGALPGRIFRVVLHRNGVELTEDDYYTILDSCSCAIGGEGRSPGQGHGGSFGGGSVQSVLRRTASGASLGTQTFAMGSYGSRSWAPSNSGFRREQRPGTFGGMRGGTGVRYDMFLRACLRP